MNAARYVSVTGGCSSLIPCAKQDFSGGVRARQSSGLWPLTGADSDDGCWSDTDMLKRGCGEEAGNVTDRGKPRKASRIPLLACLRSPLSLGEAMALVGLWAVGACIRHGWLWDDGRRLHCVYPLRVAGDATPRRCPPSGRRSRGGLPAPAMAPFPHTTWVNTAVHVRCRAETGDRHGTVIECAPPPS